MTRIVVGILVVALVLAALEPSSKGRSPAPPPARIAVIVLENRSYSQVIGNPRAPYLNSLARRGALATRYYAVTHPSLPNYIAMTTGGHAGVTANCSSCRSHGRTLANQLDAAGISWRAYFESLPAAVTAGYQKGLAYNRHYNPFVYAKTLGPRELGSLSNFHRLARDMAGRSLPRFSWIAPNVWHDGHNARLEVADRFAARLVPRVLKALGPHGLLLLTWDEGRRADRTGAHGRGGGHVPLIALGPLARAGARVTVRADHYALLKTIEAQLRLTRLGHARDSTTPVLSGLLRG